jgi:hypothetical protein
VFAQTGSTVHLGAKEPDRGSAIEDYDDGDNGYLISSAIHFDILARLEDSFDIDTRIRAATVAFVAMKDVFFDKISVSRLVSN